METFLSIHRPLKLSYSSAGLLWLLDDTNKDWAKDRAAIWSEIGKEIISSRASNFQDMTTLQLLTEAWLLELWLDDYGQRIAFVLVIGLTTAYGGIHMATWNYLFPSVVESLALEELLHRARVFFLA